MSTAPKYLPHYTVEDYNLWEGDWELWQGTAVAMTPSPFGRHSQLLAQLARAFGNAVEAADCEATVLAEIDWIISNDTVVRPDLTIVCGDAPERHVEDTPAVVVEILSAATRERDETFKKDLYQEQGVRWYLIVDPNTDELTPLRLSGESQYTCADVDGGILTLDICDDCELSIQVSKIF